MGTDTVDAIRASARPAEGRSGSRPAAGPSGDLKTLVEDYERDLILTALAEAGGHQRRAAASLGILPTTLCEKIKRLGLRQRQDE
jgi:DNA-binding NtrC family response regulator